MQSRLVKVKVELPLSGDLRSCLDALCTEISAKFKQKRRVMLVDFINHLNAQTREVYWKNRDLYAKIMVTLNAAMSRGKFYYDEL